jgi:hypothetical protein
LEKSEESPEKDVIIGAAGDFVSKSAPLIVIEFPSLTVPLTLDIDGAAYTPEVKINIRNIVMIVFFIFSHFLKQPLSL